MFKHFDSGNVAAVAFGQVAGAVAADFTLIVYANRVGSMVSDHVVNAVSEELDAAAFHELARFLIHDIRSVVTGRMRVTLPKS